MFWYDALTAFVVAVLVVALFAAFVPATRWRGDAAGPDAGPSGVGLGAAGLALFFVLVFLGAWAGGAWAAPYAAAWGLAWLAFLLIGVAVAALIAGAGWTRPRTPAEQRVEAEIDRAEAERTLGDDRWAWGGVGIGLWVLLVALLVVIAAAYMPWPVYDEVGPGL